MVQMRAHAPGDRDHGEVVAAWLDRENGDDRLDAWDYVNTADPAEQWCLIIDLLAPEDGAEQAGLIGAGPLEVFIGKAAQRHHRVGDDSLVRLIVTEAQSNERLREALGGAWPDDVEGPEVWDQFDAVLGTTTEERVGHRFKPPEGSGEWTLARSVRARERERERRPDGYIEAVAWRPVKDADREFRLWLDFLRIEREELPNEAIRVDTGRGPGGDQRRYLVRADAIPE